MKKQQSQPCVKEAGLKAQRPKVAKNLSAPCEDRTRFADYDPTITEHKQVTIWVGNEGVEVDEGIGPLMELIWLAEIDTMLSCQEIQPGIAWICFPSPSDATTFLNIVAQYEGGADSVYQRVLGSDDRSLPAWSVDGELENRWGYERRQRRARWSFSVSIRFPTTDIPLLMARLKRHNARRDRSSTKLRVSQ